MTSIDAFTGVRVAGMWRSSHAPTIAASRKRHAAAIAAPRKRHAAAGTAVASVHRGSI